MHTIGIQQFKNGALTLYNFFWKNSEISRTHRKIGFIECIHFYFKPHDHDM